MKDTTTEITRPAPIYAAIVKIPGEPPAKFLAPKIPRKKPPTPPATIDPIRAALFCKVTP